MTAAALTAVTAAWNTYVWAHADIAAITSAVLNYEFDEDGEVDDSVILDPIDFFEWTVTERREFSEIGDATGRAIISVGVRYTLEQDTEGAYYNTVRDALVKVMDLVESQLGTTWQGSVDYYDYPAGNVDVRTGVVNGTSVYRGEIVFRAVKH